MFNKIVVPLDGSKLAEGVLPHVIEVIRGQESQVYLLSASPLTKKPAPGAVSTQPASVDASNPQSIEQELIKYLQTVAKKLEPLACSVQVKVRFGRPANEILAFASEIEADLIIMSTHGRSGISRWVFGSVADRLLRGASCPVLLVRAEQAQSQASYQNILVPLDGSELAEQVLPYVKALIHAPKYPTKEKDRRVTHIYLISVLTTGLGDRTVTLLTSYPPGMQLATTALHHAEVQLQTYLRSVAAALRDRGTAVHIAIREGSPANEILTYAAEIGADLISMTTHGLSGVSRWVYGNAADKVLQGTHSPVLLVRPTSEQGGKET